MNRERSADAIYRSPRAGLTIPAVALTEFVLAKRGAEREQTALVDTVGGATYTYAALEERVRRTAGGLAARGFRRGDVLALWAPNSIDYPVLFHAAALAGGATTTINPLYTAREAARQIADSGARVLVTSPALAPAAREAVREAPVEQRYVFGACADVPDVAELAQAPPLAAQVAVDAHTDVVALPYSSGTTGLPKGVMLTHRNLVANVLQLGTSGHFSAGDRYLCVLPMFHIYGLVAITNVALHLGATLYVAPKYELTSLLATLASARITVAHLVPPIVLQLSKHPDVVRGAFPHLRTIFSGAAPLSPPVIDACRERIGVDVIQGYGMTEASPTTHVSPVERELQCVGSVGSLAANTECRIVDPESGRDVERGARGEIWVRGPQVMRGYLNQPEATRATVDEEGWLHTGDIGLVDEREQLHVVDRLKELIKYKGFQIAPAELEAVLVAHPAVADAAVIPVADDEAGEVPKAFVVRRAPIEASELLAFVASHVAPHKKLRALEFVEVIPRSPSGKILRRVLVAAERARGLGPAS